MRSIRVKLALLFFATVFILNCNKAPDEGNTTPPAAAIGVLDCSNRLISSNPIEDSAYTGTVQVAYTGGNGASYPAGANIASTGVNGLTAKLTAGTLTGNNGYLVFSISGTADTSGTAFFNISFGGQSCTFTIPVYTPYGPIPVINYISCGNWPIPNNLTHTMPYTGVWTVDVNAAFATNYGPGTPIASVGVAGLTATMRAGTLTTPFSSTLVFDVTGTPASTGIIQFPISFGGKTCTLMTAVDAPSTYCWQLTGVAKLACLAEEFYSLLTPAERAQTILPLTLANARRWSWEPTTVFPRNGILLENLESLKALRAVALMKAVMGDTGFMYNADGYKELSDIRNMDGYLRNFGSSAYGTDRYSLSFLGTPSATGRWILQISGHHFAQQYLFDGGQLLGITPNFRGAEPMVNPFDSNQPMVDEVAVSRGILMRMNAAQLAAARLPGTVTDLLMGTGTSAGTYPAVKQGVKMSTLSDTVKLWMRSMLRIYYQDVNYTFMTPFSTRYLAEVDDVYVSYSGNLSGVPGNAASFMNDTGDYIRLDGPNLWIEVLFVNGHALPVKHVHAVFRDRSLDYLGL